jgi:TRAP-type C4-dicarboxylate transport system substrate-binding protein
VKAVMDTAAKNAYKKGFQEQDKIDEGSIKFLKDRGINVKIFTLEENTAWKKATKPAYEMYLKRCSDKGSGDTARTILEVFQ